MMKEAQRRKWGMMEYDDDERGAKAKMGNEFFCKCLSDSDVGILVIFE